MRAKPNCWRSWARLEPACLIASPSRLRPSRQRPTRKSPPIWSAQSSKAGNPTGASPSPRSRMIEFGDTRLPRRFWDKVSPEPHSGCWLWLGAHTAPGYGDVYDRKSVVAGESVQVHVAPGGRPTNEKKKE